LLHRYNVQPISRRSNRPEPAPPEAPPVSRGLLGFGRFHCQDRAFARPGQQEITRRRKQKLVNRQ
jgi:hypothetical protein